MSDRERKTKLKKADLESHLYAIWAVDKIFTKQNQPIDILDCDKRGFTLRMRVNLQNVQAQRLLVNPINNDVVDYKATADFDNKELRVELDAIPRRKTKPIGDTGEVAA